MFEESPLPLDPDQILPLHIGIIGQPGHGRDLVQSALQAAGWSADMLSEVALTGRAHGPLDGVVVCVGDITPRVLNLVTEVAQNPLLIVLVVGTDRNPQNIADILRSGASDYLPSPFAGEELVARIRALAMRSPPLAEQRQEVQPVFDSPSRTIVAGPHAVTLSQREWDALSVLLEAESTLVTVAQLSERMTGVPGNETTVTSAISRLRRKLRASQFHVISVETVHGQGYVARFRRASDYYPRMEGHP